MAGRPAYGRSLIADPWGIVVAEAPDEETVIAAELDRARLRAMRAAAVAREPPGGRLPVAHPRLAWAEEIPEGREWLGRLPQLMSECEEEWGVSSRGEPFPAAYAALTYRWPTGGGPAVLKIAVPAPGGEHEAEALECWTVTARCGCSRATRSGARCCSSVSCPALAARARRTRST